MKYILSIIVFVLIIGCQIDGHQNQDDDSLFTSVQGPELGIDFENRLPVNDSMNYFKYGYFYMGGGVASGDVNGDNLPDLFFTGNMTGNKLYLNKGNNQFEDISQSSTIGESKAWHTGCAMGDVNEDGLLDILVSVGGIWKDNRNLIYVNQGNVTSSNPQFLEMGASLGLADTGNSIQMAQIDYDRDGDLDIYVLNYPITPLDIKAPGYIRLVDNPTWESSDHLYRNDGNGKYVDVTEQAGVMKFGLGIGVVISDLNDDGWSDIYVSNDFQTPDFFYINNQDGTFTNQLDMSFRHTSFFGMGVDVGDVNNDLLPDLMQVDMNSDNNYRSKANMSSMDIPGFMMMINSSLGYQYMYNSLQVHNGYRPDGIPFFSDIGLYANVASTDWSWSCLFSDFDLDGFSDLYITNGTRKDINNKDYFNWLKSTDTRMKVRYKELTVQDLVEKMPAQPLDNYMFRNNGKRFEKINEEWQVSFTGFSNGASYLDLDQDGDLDLVVNNIDTTVTFHVNNADKSNLHFIKVKLKGEASNHYCLGSKVLVFSDSLKLMRELNPVRGYQSSMDTDLHFGLGHRTAIDSLVIRWPDGSHTINYNLKVDQTISIDISDAIKVPWPRHHLTKTYFSQVSSPDIIFKHEENEFNDFDREILLPHKMSSFGPGLEIGDINKDGRDDVFIGGARNQTSIIYISNGEKSYNKVELSGKIHEDNTALIIDVDNDGYNDLLVGSGGNEVDSLSSDYYRLRYYKNNNGNLKTKHIDLPINVSASTITEVDIIDDGLPEILIGGRQVPGKYPLPADCTVLKEMNQLDYPGIEKFEKLGMVTDIVSEDIDGDGRKEILVVGEWMAPKVFTIVSGEIKEMDIGSLGSQVGWWQDIEAADFDSDGDVDFILSNLGTNYKYKANNNKTFDIYSNDFDQDADLDIVLSYHQDGHAYPLRGKQCSSQQLPELNNKFPNYHSFASSNLQQIYGTENLTNSTKYEANNFHHIYIENQNGKLVWRNMESAFQRYAINSTISKDIDQDGHVDIVMAGNIFDSEAETPRADACYGIVGLNRGDGTFRFIDNNKSGLFMPYEIRNMEFLSIGNKSFLIAGVNNGPLLMHQLNELE